MLRRVRNVTQNILNSFLRSCVRNVQVDGLNELIAAHIVLITAHIVLIMADIREMASTGIGVAGMTEHGSTTVDMLLSGCVKLFQKRSYMYGDSFCGCDSVVELTISQLA